VHDVIRARGRSTHRTACRRHGAKIVTGPRAPQRRRTTMRAARLFVAICASATIATAANAQGIDWQKVDAALGRSAAVTGDVHRYGFPRTDLQVTVDGVTIRPSLALGGWAAFKPMSNMAMVMGDLVLLGSEINPVISKLKEGG